MLTMEQILANAAQLGLSDPDVVIEVDDLDGGSMTAQWQTPDMEITITAFYDEEDSEDDFDIHYGDPSDVPIESVYVQYHSQTGQFEAGLDNVNDVLKVLILVTRHSGAALQAALSRAGILVNMAGVPPAQPQAQPAAKPQSTTKSFTFNDIMQALNAQGVQLKNVRHVTHENDDDDVAWGENEYSYCRATVSWGKFGIEISCSNDDDNISSAEEAFAAPLATFGFGVYPVKKDGTFKDNFITAVYSQDEFAHNPHLFKNGETGDDAFSVESFVTAFMTFYGKDLTNKRTLTALEQQLEDLGIVEIGQY